MKRVPTHLVILGGQRWPAIRYRETLVVDLRLHGEDGHGFYADRLRDLGLAADLVAAAGESQPRGFVLVDAPIPSTEPTSAPLP